MRIYLLLAIWPVAVCVAALRSVNQVLNALLDSFPSLLVRAHRVVVIVASEEATISDLLLERHIVLRTLVAGIVALLAKVEVAARFAVPARRDPSFADVAREGLGREAPSSFA